MQPLPIDGLLPAALDSLRRVPALVLTAEPGAGKTTRVPPALLAAVQGEVLVLEPRRLAARLSAVRVAEEQRARLGGLVGYQVRFDDRTSKETRLTFLTEGILLRRLLSDPELRGVGAVVLDEFHERSLQSDLLLAFLRQLQRGVRPELRLVVMSATLAAEPVSAFLGDCPRLHAPGRSFPIAVSYSDPSDARPLEDRVASAVAGLLRGPVSGDLLVFLPGMAEIRGCARRLGSPPGVEVLPLHGALSPEAQDRAVRPSALRKVILSTNVAETSLTIEGVSAVVDSGLARIAGHSPWSGLPTLKVLKISRAAAAQRAGRAGRTQAGEAVRLYGKADHDGRPSHELPEIQRADLAEPVLLLRALRVESPTAFPWFEPPPAEALAQADALLRRLGALAGDRLSPLGTAMAALPLHPRLSRVLLEGQRRGVGAEAATLVALLQEREIAAPSEREVGDSDPLWALEQLERRQADPLGAAAVARSARQLRGLVERAKQGAPETSANLHDALRLCLLTGYPDRVARRRKPGSGELLLAGGGTARLSPQSVVKEAQLLLAIDAEEQRRLGEAALGQVFSASAIESEWLLDLFPERLREERRVRFLPESERVDVDSQLFYDALLLEESRSPPSAEELEGPVAEALAAAALERGPSAYLSAERAAAGEPDRTLARLAFARAALPELSLPEAAPAVVAEAVRMLARGKRRFDELRAGDLVEALLAPLSAPQRQALEAAAPNSVALPGGRRAAIHYTLGQPPWIEARLQDFMGWSAGPRLAKGRVALTLHLLAPNQRAVQVTSDLAGFWERHYPQVRRALSRRYPRHPWPDDPRRPLPPRPAKPPR